MSAAQLYRPAPGAMVRCPADRGEDAYSGRVLSVGEDVRHNIHGAPFVWVTVRKKPGHSVVWPSNRLEPGA